MVIFGPLVVGAFARGSESPGKVRVGAESRCAGRYYHGQRASSSSLSLSVRRQVKKPGPNQSRYFWSCGKSPVQSQCSSLKGLPRFKSGKGPCLSAARSHFIASPVSGAFDKTSASALTKPAPEQTGTRLCEGTGLFAGLLMARPASSLQTCANGRHSWEILTLPK